MNILLTSVGRMTYYINYFKEAVGTEGRVIVATGVPNLQAKEMADKFYSVPLICKENYLESILNICKNERIDYLFSLHDLDNTVLARSIDTIKKVGVVPIISKSSVIELCLDKYKSFEFLKLNNINTPNTWLTPEDFFSDKKCEFPVILKPRFGYGSINHLFANNKDELLSAYHYLESSKDQIVLKCIGANVNESCTVIQEVLTGEEFGLEVVNNLEKELIAQFHKRKLGMAAGETQGAQIIFKKSLANLGLKLSQQLGHIGYLDCDIIFKKDAPFVLDVNPRFGGQYPFSHWAGANVPEVIISNFKIPANKLNLGDSFIKYTCVTKIQNEIVVHKKKL